MARQNYNVNTSEKKVEVFGSFGGGMVTQPHPEKLKSDESLLVENADILAGGAVQNRGAYAQTNTSLMIGNTQGRFKYQGLGESLELVAVSGQLYAVVGDTYTLLSINGLPSFQTTRPVEAVQLREKMYIATGSGIVVYEGGESISLMTPYAPNGLEALYIGTNGLAADPLNYLSDTTGAGNVILGVTSSSRYGLVNVNVTFTAYVQKVVTDTLEYQFETKRVDQPVEDYDINKAFSTDKTFTVSFPTKADYMVRVTIRKQGTTVNLSQYVLPRYKVNTTPDEKPEPEINFEDMKLCNRILIHYDRLLLYGDTGNPDFLYISHLDKFDYFPRTNIIKVTDPLRGSLNNVTRFKELLVCFTNGSIQMITGTNPSTYELQPVHTTLGTKFNNSVQVMQNYIVFVGNDNGIYVLKTFNFASTNKMNVERIDDKIKDSIVGLISGASRIVSAIYDNQYYVYIENGEDRLIYRFYHDLGVWVRDSLAFPINTMENVDNTLVLTSPTGGIIYRLKRDVFRDGLNKIFRMRIKSKHFNMDVAHHRKKMKQYQLLAKLTSKTTINLGVYVDDKQVINTPLSFDPLQEADTQKLTVTASGRFRYTKTDLNIPVHENLQLTGFGFIFKENTPK